MFARFDIAFNPFDKVLVVISARVKLYLIGENFPKCENVDQLYGKVKIVPLVCAIDGEILLLLLCHHLLATFLDIVT